MLSHAESLSHTYNSYHPRLRSFISRRFPGFGPGRVDDVVSATFEAVVMHPDRLTAAWQRGGDARAYGLLKVIAWRQARNLYRRASFRAELSIDSFGPGACEPGTNTGLEAWLHVQRTLPGAIARAASAVCPSRSDALQRALEDKIASGDPDTAVARRHDLPREYVNRAKKLLLEELLGG